MISETFHGKLIAKREGAYTIYVFQDDAKEYHMCTKLPNWGIYNINIGDTGFVTTEAYVCGEKYYNRNTDKDEIIKFSNVYFKEYIADNKGEEQIIL